MLKEVIRGKIRTKDGKVSEYARGGEPESLRIFDQDEYLGDLAGTEETLVVVMDAAKYDRVQGGYRQATGDCRNSLREILEQQDIKLGDNPQALSFAELLDKAARAIRERQTTSSDDGEDRRAPPAPMMLMEDQTYYAVVCEQDGRLAVVSNGPDAPKEVWNDRNQAFKRRNTTYALNRDFIVAEVVVVDRASWEDAKRRVHNKPAYGIRYDVGKAGFVQATGYGELTQEQWADGCAVLLRSIVDRYGKGYAGHANDHINRDILHRVRAWKSDDDTVEVRGAGTVTISTGGGATVNITQEAAPDRIAQVFRQELLQHHAATPADPLDKHRLAAVDRLTASIATLSKEGNHAGVAKLESILQQYLSPKG